MYSFARYFLVIFESLLVHLHKFFATVLLYYAKITILPNRLRKKYDPTIPLCDLRRLNSFHCCAVVDKILLIKFLIVFLHFATFLIIVDAMSVFFLLAHCFVFHSSLSPNSLQPT